MGSPHLALCRVERHRPDDHASTAQFLQPHDASLRPPQNENTEISGSAVARLSPRGAGSNRTGSAFGSAPVTGARGAPNPIALDFPTSQRIDIQLLNPAGEVLTRWSENHAFTEEIGNVLINPREQIVYNETIATRELQPGRVYSVDVFFPRYPELRTRQKFMTAP